MTVYDSTINFLNKSLTTATPGANDPEVGQVMRDGDENYIFVYNASNSEIKTGDVCCVSAVSGYSVTASTTTAVDLAVGVCKHASIATGYYGWLLTRGFGQVNMHADNSVAAGGALVCGDLGKFFNKTISTGVPTPIIAKAMAAIASGVSGTAFISIF
jgi:hypothetical protein